MSVFSFSPGRGLARTRAMRRWANTSLCLAGAGLLLSAHTAQASQGQILVRTSVLAPGTQPSPGTASTQSLARTNALIQTQLSAKVAGAKVRKTFEETGWALIDVPQGSNALSKLQASLGANNVVADRPIDVSNRTVTQVALPNSTGTTNKVRPTAIPNDPGYIGGQQYWLDKISAPGAWDITTGSDTVVVAVLDTGSQLNHPDLVNNLWTNPKEIPGNGRDDDNNGYIDDYYGISAVPGEENLPPNDTLGFGTFSAGIIGAQTNNAQGVAGINWKVKIMSLRFLSEDTSYTSAAVECLNYVIKMKKRGVNIRVTSNAWSVARDSATGGNDPALESAFKAAGQAGIINIVSAGSASSLNIDTTPLYPASYTEPSILTVAASNEDDSPFAGSNVGVNSVDLAAPGSNIFSLSNDSFYGTGSGAPTSTAMVSGAAALLIAKENRSNPAQIKERILKTVDRVDTWQGKTVTGGRLNLYRMLTNDANGFPSISGLVYRLIAGDKYPLKGAKVTVGGKTATTGEDGTYLLTSVKPGTYKVTPKLKGYKFTQQTVSLPSNSGNLVYDFEGVGTQKRYYLTGTAVGADGKPIEGVSIYQNTNKGKTLLATTDANGKYIALDLQAGTYRLTAQAPDSSIELVPDPTAIKLPTKSGTNAPNGIVNFGLLIGDGPTVTITSPSTDVLIPQNVATPVTINAKDDNGVDHIYYILSYIFNGKTTYYNWKNKKWTNNPDEPAVLGDQDVEGKDVTITVTLPKSKEGRYIFKASAKDDNGNYTASEGVAQRILDVIIDNTSIKKS